MKEKAVSTATPTLPEILLPRPRNRIPEIRLLPRKRRSKESARICCHPWRATRHFTMTSWRHWLNYQQTLTSLQDELIQLKETIPGLEKKSIKRLKLAGTLTSLDKESQKIKLKASQKRKKDLHRMDEFGLVSLRTLRALNRKIAER